MNPKDIGLIVVAIIIAVPVLSVIGSPLLATLRGLHDQWRWNVSWWKRPLLTLKWFVILIAMGQINHLIRVIMNPLNLPFEHFVTTGFWKGPLELAAILYFVLLIGTLFTTWIYSWYCLLQIFNTLLLLKAKDISNWWKNIGKDWQSEPLQTTSEQPGEKVPWTK